MTAARSMFTEAIEDHLALKKQNAHLNTTMPTTKFDVGDPLDRYPGGPVRPAVGGYEEQAMATNGAPSAYQQEIEPLQGMAPMLSLVDDLDEVDSLVPETPTSFDQPTALMSSADLEAEAASQVVRFPGATTVRSEEFVETSYAADVQQTETWGEAEADSDEQPVIVIDVDEPLAPTTPGAHRFTEPQEPRSAKRGGLFGKLRRSRKSSGEPGGQGWFSGTPRDFTWDD